MKSTFSEGLLKNALNEYFGAGFCAGARKFFTQNAWNIFSTTGKLINTSVLESFVPILTINFWLQATAVYFAVDSATKGKVITGLCFLLVSVFQNN